MSLVEDLVDCTTFGIGAGAATLYTFVFLCIVATAAVIFEAIFLRDWSGVLRADVYIGGEPNGRDILVAVGLAICEAYCVKGLCIHDDLLEPTVRGDINGSFKSESHCCGYMEYSKFVVISYHNNLIFDAKVESILNSKYRIFKRRKQ